MHWRAVRSTGRMLDHLTPINERNKVKENIESSAVCGRLVMVCMRNTAMSVTRPNAKTKRHGGSYRLQCVAVTPRLRDARTRCYF